MSKAASAEERTLKLSPHISQDSDRNLRPLSLTPSFSWVWERHQRKNRFNGLPHTVETVETVPTCPDLIFTQLKLGVNERRAKITRPSTIGGIFKFGRRR